MCLLREATLRWDAVLSALHLVHVLLLLLSWVLVLTSLTWRELIAVEWLWILWVHGLALWELLHTLAIVLRHLLLLHVLLWLLWHWLLCLLWLCCLLLSTALLGTVSIPLRSIIITIALCAPVLQLLLLLPILLLCTIIRLECSIWRLSSKPSHELVLCHLCGIIA